ncbi:hypothetical protein ACFSC6_13335 [Rufibacter sediminis]|uniref:Glycosyl-4,4'-diaponeurosporenoate acyltransferase n=1 Tax=Rufibacter sediminis TaxID=2762756 RepID=A0ABR6VY89_9BACT|nr:hypothetical protein [Rufibacter sediminis]MBC3542179.1 hypothetical protein [Rufibacter sediminis]
MAKNYRNWALSVVVTLVTFTGCYFLGRHFGFSSFVFSWVLNFALMSWITMVIALLNPAFESDYFTPKPFERDGKVYTYAGVHLYRKLLVWVGWEKLNKATNPVKKDVTALHTCERSSRKSEAGHVMIALVVFAVAAVFTPSLGEAKWLILLNVLFNIFPVMVQRYNRPRYLRVLSVMQRKRAAQPFIH